MYAKMMLDESIPGMRVGRDKGWSNGRDEFK
jgi:hypothetical protein